MVNLSYLKQRFSYWLESTIALLLPFIVQRSLKTKLNALYVQGNWQRLNKSGLIFAVNHHSWWDVYLALFLAKHLGRSVSAIMDDAQLDKFRFFRRVGALGRKELREALRRIKRGDLFFVFPEGELRQAAKIENLERGVLFLAKSSRAPIYPLIFKVVMRGAQYPEAFIVLGDELKLSGNEEADLISLKNTLNNLLECLDETLTTTNPEQAPEGFVKVLSGQGSTHERTSWLSHWWSK